MKKRLDLLLVEKGLAASREKAKAIIMSGVVFVDGSREDKAGTSFDENAAVEVRGETLPYVSRGGFKLEKAMRVFPIALEGRNCIDVGSSTGGFTDCMLQNGAVKVYAVDVGHGQLAWKLRNDERVINMEKCNVRYLDPDEIGRESIDFISIDVSFISLKLVFPVAGQLLHENGCLVCLVKPQFEAGREQVGRKGIVRDPEVHRQVIEKVIAYGEENGLFAHGLTFSPVTGTKGNIEYLLLMKKQKCNNRIDVENIVAESHNELQ